MKRNKTTPLTVPQPSDDRRLDRAVAVTDLSTSTLEGLRLTFTFTSVLIYIYEFEFESEREWNSETHYTPQCARLIGKTRQVGHGPTHHQAKGRKKEASVTKHATKHNAHKHKHNDNHQATERHKPAWCSRVGAIRQPRVVTVRNQNPRNCPLCSAFRF